VTQFDFIIPEYTGSYEPGHSGYVSRVKISNIGMMPSPLHSDIALKIINNKWIQGGELRFIPRGIPPN
jgi:hypothetical protein